VVVVPWVVVVVGRVVVGACVVGGAIVVAGWCGAIVGGAIVVAGAAVDAGAIVVEVGLAVVDVPAFFLAVDDVAAAVAAVVPLVEVPDVLPVEVFAPLEPHAAAMKATPATAAIAHQRRRSSGFGVMAVLSPGDTSGLDCA
jgi:hypothetical protein